MAPPPLIPPLMICLFKYTIKDLKTMSLYFNKIKLVLRFFLTIISHGRQDLFSLLPWQGTKGRHIIWEHGTIATQSYSCTTTHMLNAWTTD